MSFLLVPIFSRAAHITSRNFRTTNLLLQLDMNSLFQTTSRLVFGRKPILNTLIQTRNKMKTHKAAAKRFIKTGTGYKRKQAGRNHGNGGFSSNSLRHLDSFVSVTDRGSQLKKLKKFLEC